MSDVNVQDVKKLRASTGAGLVECRNALLETGGDLASAEVLLRGRSAVRVEERSGRKTGDGYAASYVHGDGRIVAVVELRCETDFVSRTADFRTVAKGLAMHVASEAPTSLAVFLTQPYLLDDHLTVEEVVRRLAASLGENVHVGRFTRIGVDDKR